VQTVAAGWATSTANRAGSASTANRAGLRPHLLRLYTVEQISSNVHAAEPGAGGIADIAERHTALLDERLLVRVCRLATACAGPQE
jgi:hypothetical protein